MELLSAYNTGSVSQFEATLRNTLLKLVPDLCSPSLNPDTDEEYKKLEQRIFILFEQFICGDENPDQVVESLKHNEVPSSFCGHVFKGGEPTYSCRKCAMDPTCVFCGPCFSKSSHTDHDYTVNSSSGGGYCDCGDPEAWTSEPWCSYHAELRDQKALPSESPSLPDDIETRCEIMVTRIFRLAVRFMASTSEALREKWELRNPRDRYVVILHNNEVNTYDEVIRTLERCLKVSRQEATDFATIVDRIGKSNVLLCDNQNEASRIADLISNYIRDINTSGVALQCEAIHTDLAAFSCFGVYCIRWLRNLSDRLVGFRHVICRSVFLPDTGMAALIDRNGKGMDTANNWLEFLILSDSILWKFARNEIHEFYLTVIFKEAEWKKEFAIMYTRNYMNITLSYAHNDYYVEESIVMMSVQLYTVISMAHYLLEYENVLVRLMEPLLDLLTNLPQYKNSTVSTDIFPPEPVRLQDASRQRFPPWKRLAQNLHDVEYILRCPTPEVWNTNLRDNFVAGVDSLLRLLAFIQDMDSSKRQVEYHVEMEIEWEYGVKLYIQLYNAITLMARWAAADAILFDRVCELVVEKTQRYVFRKDVEHSIMRRAEGQPPANDGPVCDFDESCSSFKVSEEYISLHQPFVRLLTSLIMCHAKAPESLCNPLVKVDPAIPMWVVMERPLRCLIWSSQVFANMWRRNGYAMVSMNFFYRSNRFARERLDRDLQMLQYAASCMDPDVFMSHVMRGFGLLDWLRKKEKPLIRDELKTFYKVLEEFLLILVYIVSERCQVGIGIGISEDDVYRNELIHLLSRGPFSHSDLIKDMSDHEALKTENIFEKLISDVAFTRQKMTTTTCTVQFILKSEFCKEYNPFYYHYYNTDRTQAIEAHRRRLKEETTDSESVVIHPPRPLQLTPTFSGLTRLLSCRAFIVICHRIISEAVCSGNRATSNMSDNVVERILHLIAIGLLDDEYNSKEKYPFVKALRGETFPDKDIVTCLQSLSDCMDRDDLKKLLQWVLRKTSTLERRLKENLEALDESTSVLMDVDKKGKDSTVDLTSCDESMSMSTGDMDEEFSGLSNTISLSSNQKPSSMKSDESKSSGSKLSASEKQKHDAMRRRQRLMAKMSAMQKNFVKENEALLKEANVDTGQNQPHGSGSMDEPDSKLINRTDSMTDRVQQLSRKVVLGSGRMLSEDCRDLRDVLYRCILCQEDSPATTKDRCIVVTGFIMRSTVLRRDHGMIQKHVAAERAGDTNGGNPLVCSPLPKDAFMNDQTLFASAWLPYGVYFSSCGHHMHSDCWNKCFEAHQRRQQRRNRMALQPHQRDFPCPLCNKPCNTVLPLTPELNRLETQRRLFDILSSSLMYSEWLTSMLVSHRAAHIPIQSSRKTEFRAVAPSLASMDVSPEVNRLYTSHYGRPLLKKDRPTQEYKEMLIKFANDNLENWKGRTLENQQVPPFDQRVVTYLRRTTAYTLASMEQYLRYCNHIEESENESRSDRSVSGASSSVCGKNTPLFGGMPSTRQWESTQALIRLACIAQGQLTEAIDSQRLRSTVFVLLRPLLPLEDPRDEHEAEAYHEVSTSLLTIDMFDLLVSLVMSSPIQFLGSDDFRLETVPVGSVVDLCLLRLCYAGQIYQAILSPKVRRDDLWNNCASASVEAMEAEEMISEKRLPLRKPNETSLVHEWQKQSTPSLGRLAAMIRERAGLDAVEGLTTDADWKHHLRIAVLPFLRCSALFFNCITGVEPPTGLTAEGWCEADQFDTLCSYLDLNTDFVSHLFGRDDTDHSLPSPMVRIVDWWCQRDSKVLQRISAESKEIALVHYPVELNTLISLPYQYTSVLNQAVHFKCPTYSTSDEFRPAALCLVCGKIVCWGIYCCQTEVDGKLVGVLPLHLNMCGAGDTEVEGNMVDRSSPNRRRRSSPALDMQGTGIMLRMRESQILLLAYGGTRTVPYVSPYVDRYGENDIGLSRGNPLHLDLNLYHRLNRVWLLHGINDEIEAGIRQRGSTHQWFDFS